MINTKKYSILTEDQIDEIHARSVEILETTGVWVRSDQGVEILTEAGCDTSNPKSIKIPAKLIERAIQNIPETIDVYDRNGNPAMQLCPENSYFGTGADCPNIYDLETGQRRASLKDDMTLLARFADALPHMDFIMPTFVANDVPPEKRHAVQYEAVLVNSVKPCMPGCRDQHEAKVMIDMAAVAVGGYQRLRERPILIIPAGTLEPLVHTEEDLGKALTCAEYGVPFTYIPSGSLLGSTAPVTLAGALIQKNASALAGWTMVRLKYPDAKILYGSVAPAFDMKYGTFTYGSPEFNVSQMAMGDLCYHYKIPGFGFAGATDSKTLDAQAGLECALSLLLVANSGMSLIHDCGYLDAGMTSSFESILLTDEIISMIEKILKPIDFAEEALALDVIKEVGAGGSFLRHKHTLANFRKHLWTPRYLFRGRYVDWEKKGGQEICSRLNAEVKKILANHVVSELPGGMINEIRTIIERCSGGADHV